MSLDKLPIPGPDKYLSAVSDISYGFVANGGVVKSIHDYVTLQDGQKRHITDRFIKEMEGIVGYTLPIDRQLGIIFDEHDSMGPAIIMGSIAGAMVVDVAHSGYVSLRDIHDNLPPFHYSHTEDDAETKHNIAQSMLELGDMGLNIVGSLAESEVEAWEEEVIKDVANQRYFRSGFGTVILGAYSMHQNVIAREFERQVVAGSHERDWDMQLSQLLSES